MRYGNFRNKVFSEKRKFIPYPALKDVKSSDVVHNLVHTMFSSVGSLGIAHHTISASTTISMANCRSHRRASLAEGLRPTSARIFIRQIEHTRSICWTQYAANIREYDILSLLCEFSVYNTTCTIYCCSYCSLSSHRETAKKHRNCGCAVCVGLSHCQHDCHFYWTIVLNGRGI